MTDTAEMQQKVNDTRARLEQSLTALNERIEPKAIMEQSMNYLSEHGPDVARGGLDFVRENPLAVGVVAAGLAWLALGGGPNSRQISNRARQPFSSGHGSDGRAYDAKAFDVYADDKYAGDYRPHHLAGGSDDESLSDRARDLGDNLKHRASAAMDKAGDATASATTAAREFGSDAADSAKDLGSNIAESSREAFDAGVEYARSAAGSTANYGSKQLQERPLVVGGIALLGGVALAMMLPRTRAEARLVGDQAQAAREAAVRRSQQAYSTARERAAEAVDVVKDQASQAADTLKGQAGSVARDIGETVKAQVKGSGNSAAKDSSGKLNNDAGLQVGATNTASSGSKVVTADADGSSGSGSRGHNSPASTKVTHNDPDKLRPNTKADENKTRDQLS